MNNNSVSRVVSNDVDESCRDQCVTVSAPPGMTWRELKNTAVSCVTTPGFIYARHAGKRARKAGVSLGCWDGDWSFDEEGAGLLGACTLVPSFVVSLILADTQVVGLAPQAAVLVGGTVAGVVGAQWVWWNGFSTINGLYLDAKTLCRKVNTSTLGQRLDRLGDTPVRETFRLSKRDSKLRRDR